MTVDAVDNCRGPRNVAGYNADFGPFSRVFGDRVNGAEGQGAGPFDPLRPQTLLSDGKLDAGDAPMPAARVDVEIAANTPGGINGAGALEKADKTEVYSRDGNGTASPHNLYAPYYKQWIPATSAEDVNPRASGTDWFVQNNFPGAPVRARTTTGTCTALSRPRHHRHGVQPHRRLPGRGGLRRSAHDPGRRHGRGRLERRLAPGRGVHGRAR